MIMDIEKSQDQCKKNQLYVDILPRNKWKIKFKKQYHLK